MENTQNEVSLSDSTVISESEIQSETPIVNQESWTERCV